MTWRITDQIAAIQPIATTDTTQNHPLGTVVRAYDDTGTYGAGEFIYLKGVANTTTGLVVSYDAATFLTALLTSAVGVGRPAAVAMSANVASQYGWYQISGVAAATKASGTSFAAAAPFSVAAGVCAAAATTNRMAQAVLQAAASGASAVTAVKIAINRPAGPSSD